MKEVKPCKECGRTVPVSSNGLCKECAEKRSEEAIEQIKRKEGPIYERWREGMVNSDSGVNFEHLEEKTTPSTKYPLSSVSEGDLEDKPSVEYMNIGVG